MGYKGTTYRIPLDKGGFSGNTNLDAIEPIMMVDPSRNINLHEGSRDKRGGTSIVDTTSSVTNCMGLFDFTLNNGTQHLVRAWEKGGQVDIYKDNTNIIKTALTTAKYIDFEVLNNNLYLCNGSDIPQVWSGAGNTTALSTPHAGWGAGGVAYPFQLIKHGIANTERLWAIGAASKSVYYSVLNDGVSEADFASATSGNFYIETGDGQGITGGVEFGDRLIVFSNWKAYIIDDTNTTVANWGYQEVQWKGGVANHKLIVRLPNDIVCMTVDGHVYSVTAAEQYGDYKAVSLTQPSHIDKWIRDNIDMSKIAQFHATYDPILRCIKFFMVRSGNINTALVYFYDRGPEHGWIIHDNQDKASGYDASASTLYKVNTGSYSIYTGDYGGNIWKLETINANDNNQAYYGGFKTPNMSFDNERMDKNFKRGHVIMKPQGDYLLQIKNWVDGKVLSTQTTSMLGTGGTLPFVLGIDTLGGNEIIEGIFDINDRGKRVQSEYFNNTVNQKFAISKLLYDHKSLGSQQE